MKLRSLVVSTLAASMIAGATVAPAQAEDFGDYWDGVLALIEAAGTINANKQTVCSELTEKDLANIASVTREEYEDKFYTLITSGEGGEFFGMHGVDAFTEMDKSQISAAMTPERRAHARRAAENYTKLVAKCGEFKKGGLFEGSGDISNAGPVAIVAILGAIAAVIAVVTRALPGLNIPGLNVAGMR